jgi:hypothetical protein
VVKIKREASQPPAQETTGSGSNKVLQAGTSSKLVLTDGDNQVSQVSREQRNQQEVGARPIQPGSKMVGARNNPITPGEPPTLYKLHSRKHGGPTLHKRNNLITPGEPPTLYKLHSRKHGELLPHKRNNLMPGEQQLVSSK